MRFPRFLLPLALSVALVGCDAWFATVPQDDAMTENGSSSSIDAMMEVSSASSAAADGMMDNDASSVGDDAMMGQSSSGSAEAMLHEEDAMMEDDADAPSAGAYGAYTPSVLANGRTKVLFFHAAWCPICRQADTELTAWYQTHPFPISVYKVDYDTETELKQRYGVTYQHTFVLVDGDGDPLKILQGPTDAELQGMLQA